MSQSIGVIVPVYNRVRLITEALDSIASQSLVPDRVVVVDDGSTDGTDDVVRSWIGRSASPERFRMVSQPNKGVSAARNRAAAELSGCDLLAFLDSDDRWPADHLRALLAALKSDPGAIAAGVNRVVDHEGTRERKAFDHSAIGVHTAYRFIVGDMPTPSAVMIRAAAFRDAGGYDAALRKREDTDLHLKLCLLGRWVYAPGDPVAMRRGVNEKELGQAHLTEGYESLDGRILWARVVDRFLRREGAVAALRGTPWRKFMSRHWRRIACDLGRAERSEEVAWCVRRAAEINPLDIRSRVRAWLGGGAGRVPSCPDLPNQW